MIQGIVLLAGLYFGMSRGYMGLGGFLQDQKLRVMAMLLPALFALVVINILRIEGCKNPRHFGEPLRGDYAGLWRYRVGDYRILCDIQDQTIVVLVLTIGHRRQIYERGS